MFKEDSEENYLKDYKVNLFDRPSTTVDLVIFTIFNQCLHVLLVKRGQHPFKGKWALVGGYVDLHKDVDLEATAKRKLTEKTGVKSPYLEQLQTIGNNKRDPRGWTITTIYFALIPNKNLELLAGEGVEDTKWAKISGDKIEEKLAFDHDLILKHGLQRLKHKLLYTSLPIYLMPKDFTLGQLQQVYEIILNNKLDHKSFRRRMMSVDILEDTGELKTEGKRPAKLYRLKKGLKTYFFTRNLEGVEV